MSMRRMAERPIAHLAGFVGIVEPWLREKLGLTSQKTKLAEAIRYTLSRWQGLIRFLDALDPSDRIQRKNALVAGSEAVPSAAPSSPRSSKPQAQQCRAALPSRRAHKDFQHAPHSAPQFAIVLPASGADQRCHVKTARPA
ncbi:hypothetical protein MES4922_410025 [Mesorhizobium ventifaucium]|uniref:Transposase IS66 central domain-containing protein n=1 Tax=Mesorhizobium ventifaucium TaxID=666020 RepID=A0ABM9SFX7_9HYPH|nr:hypothetical protein MES4922_410025 [Mesorhizobium ventifaucium]